MEIYVGKDELYTNKNIPFSVKILLDEKIFYTGFYVRTIEQAGYAEFLDKCIKLIKESGKDIEPIIIFSGSFQLQYNTSTFSRLQNLRTVLKNKQYIKEGLPIELYSVAFIIKMDSPEEKVFNKDSNFDSLGFIDTTHKVYYYQFKER